jgi:hypothetical protein
MKLNGVPVIGFGEAVAAPSIHGSSPWPMVLATSVVSAAAGWAIEEVARVVRGKRR